MNMEVYQDGERLDLETISITRYENKVFQLGEKLNEIEIYISCVQETEVMNGFPERILDCNSYKIKLEKLNTKKRVGVYFKQNIEYVRRDDLEQNDLHIVICKHWR